ncbi:hypothetical protein [Salinisphaera hydrothermalis]|uniref:Lipoprotein n=1 Tax=Salinisphaera hydrothermalis (strain C41B8) TaxID=1304275 RepID=A0A084IPA7_SALHC|nr:hypothetical protein [Salinisphaera hydrothermalis]KEZ78541.1 hypothetical protein C41B8_04896 [Salinisphaera hydrothermalis C41B8]
MRWPEKRSGHALLAALGLALSLATTGCAHEEARPPHASQQTSTELSAPALTLLGYARRLARTTPAGREAAVRAARRQVRTAPGAVSYAYLALALGSPHQRLYTPDEAARYARLALDTKPAPWDPDARQYLSDYARLYGELTQDDETDEADRQIADLKSRLSNAQNKLKALSHIEDRLDTVENRP